MKIQTVITGKSVKKVDISNVTWDFIIPPGGVSTKCLDVMTLSTWWCPFPKNREQLV